MAKSSVPQVPPLSGSVDLGFIWSTLTPQAQESSFVELKSMLERKYGRNEDMEEAVSAVRTALSSNRVSLNKEEKKTVDGRLLYAAVRVLLAGYGMATAEGRSDGMAFLALAMNPAWLKRWGTLSADGLLDTMGRILSPRQLLYVFAVILETWRPPRYAGIGPVAMRVALTGQLLDADVAALEGRGEAAELRSFYTDDPRYLREALLQNVREWPEGASKPVLSALQQFSFDPYQEKGAAAALRAVVPKEWVSLIRSTAR